MKHYIISKFRPGTPWREYLPEIEAIFARTLTIEGAAGFSSEGSGLLRLSLYARYLHKLPYDIHHFLTVRIYEF